MICINYCNFSQNCKFAEKEKKKTLKKPVKNPKNAYTPKNFIFRFLTLKNQKVFQKKASEKKKTNKKSQNTNSQFQMKKNSVTPKIFPPNNLPKVSQF